MNCADEKYLANKPSLVDRLVGAAVNNLLVKRVCIFVARQVSTKVNSKEGWLEMKGHRMLKFPTLVWW